MSRALLLLAHGARDPRWAEPFEAMAARIRALAPDLTVRLCYLDLLAPDLVCAATEVVRAGCEHIDVVPLFLGAGGHVRNDVPRLLHELALRHPHVQWRSHPAIGEVAVVIDAMAHAALELARGAAAGADRRDT